MESNSVHSKAAGEMSTKPVTESARCAEFESVGLNRRIALMRLRRRTVRKGSAFPASINQSLRTRLRLARWFHSGERRKGRAFPHSGAAEPHSKEENHVA
jgi:hypothetical protein